jgi:putative membrane protein
MHRYGFGSYGYGGGRGEMFVMMGAVVILILVTALILYFILRRGGVGGHNLISEVNTNRAVEILNEKLANGEIGEEEYTKKKLLITGK